MLGATRVLETATAMRDFLPRGGRGLPPGQRLSRTFPRFGVHLSSPPPPVPAAAALDVRGAGAAAFTVPVADLRDMPRRTLVADFHCVAGWSVKGLTWEGVPFRTFWEDHVLPRAQPELPTTHLVFAGLDRYSTTLLLEDALSDDVLLADRLDGAPLPPAHGAPVRLVSPGQYGHMNVKHLCRIELHATEPPRGRFETAVNVLGLSLIAGHPRARVAHQERHRRLPGGPVGLLYRVVALPALAARIGPDALRGR